ncbi:MAG: nucleoside hydrolase [Actinomycetota bacterium]|nr:nucleoside hydrolase [Actinomycetota bacterium]
MTAVIPMLLDCDPGHDDAIAIVAAAHHADLVGITTVAGNAPLDRTTHNACVLRDLIGDPDLTVHAGAARPLVAEPRHAEHIHGASGLDGVELPAPAHGADGDDAVGFIIDTCRAREGVWIVAVGPCTNVALALRAAPDIGRRIAGISLMGGGTFGNRTAVAEFNIWADPHAAAVVFGYGGPLIQAPLDLTFQLQATPARIATVRQTPGRLGAVLADLLTFFSGTYCSRYHAMEGAPVHDPCAVLALTHPGLFQSVRRHVTVETVGHDTAGMTVIDQRQLVERPAANTDVLAKLDADAVWGLVTEAIGAAPP